LPDNYTVVDRDLIKNAYQYAEQAHRGQLRASGEPYITHCVAVAYILAELKVPPVVIAAALLHDTVEDTSVTLDDLREKFGNEIASLVDGVTKMTTCRVYPAVGSSGVKDKGDSAATETPDSNVKHAEGDEFNDRRFAREKAAARNWRPKHCVKH
jgi:GTP pyrophosphokinase